jgi:hypothetical protein
MVPNGSNRRLAIDMPATVGRVGRARPQQPADEQVEVAVVVVADAEAVDLDRRRPRPAAAVVASQHRLELLLVGPFGLKIHRTTEALVRNLIDLSSRWSVILRLLWMFGKSEPGSSGPLLGRQNMTAVFATPGGIPGGIDVNPTPEGLPGSKLIEDGLNWLGYIALVASVASLLIGGALWGLGQLGGNPQSAQRGRQLVVGGLIGALIAGAAVLLVGQLYNAGAGA